MGKPSERASIQLARRVRAAVGGDISRLRADAGLTIAQLSRGSGVDASYIRRLESGAAEGSLATYARLALALGADPAFRLYPTTGPTIRDRHQASIAEDLLRLIHSRWRRYLEIAVTRPSRGWIDIGLFDGAGSVFIATEIQSELRRLEQLVRWSAEKVRALPSWEGWVALGPPPNVSQLLIVRDTRRNRSVAREFRRVFASAFPADPRDALEALIGTAAWPGSSVLWAARQAESLRLIARP